VASSGPADRTARRGYWFPLLLFGALAALALPLSVLASPRAPAGVAVLISGILARIGHSRALAVITAIYAAAVCLTGWFDVQQALVIAPFPVLPARGSRGPAARSRAAAGGPGRNAGGWAARQSRSRARGRRSWTAVNRGCGAGEFAGRGRSYV
jgi:hypothetical protein